MEILVFGTANCGWCLRAKELLDSKNLEYEYIDITDNTELRKSLNDRLGTVAKTVPQVFIDNLSIGGYAELQQVIDEMN